MSTDQRPTLTVVPPPPDELAAKREQRRAETETLTCPSCGGAKWRTEWVRFADPDGDGYVVVGHAQPVWCVDCGQEHTVPGWTS